MKVLNIFILGDIVEKFRKNLNKSYHRSIYFSDHFSNFDASIKCFSRT